MVEVNLNTKGVAAYRPQTREAPASDARQNRPAQATPGERETDRVELSEAAQRADVDPLVARVRGEIAAGTYLTDERVTAAVERMFGDVAP